MKFNEYFKKINYGYVVSYFVIEIITQLSFFLILSKEEILLGEKIYLSFLSVLVFVYLFLTLINFFKSFFKKYLNKSDSFILSTIFSNIVFIILFGSNVIYDFDYPYIPSIYFGINICLFMLIICRYLIILNIDLERTTPFTLYELYKNDNYDRKSNIVIDRPINKGIFHNDNIMEYLVNTINNYNDSEKLIVHLDGPWGSGKTTLINRAKAKFDDNIIFIDDFNYWSYENPQKTFEALFKKIALKVDKTISNSELIRFVENLLSSIMSYKGIVLPDFSFDKNPDLYEFTNSINDILKRSGKKIVLLIDDFDRDLGSNTIFMLKVLCNFIKFENIIYILSYDTEIMRKYLLDKNIDQEYLEKIIDVTFKVPSINNNVDCEIVKACITKQSDYIVSKSQFKNTISIDKFLFLLKSKSYFNTPRQLVIFLNMMETLYSYYDHSIVDLDQLLAYQMIKNFRPDIYNEIEDFVKGIRDYKNIENNGLDYLSDNLAKRDREYIKSSLENNKVLNSNKDLIVLLYTSLHDAISHEIDTESIRLKKNISRFEDEGSRGLYEELSVNKYAIANNEAINDMKFIETTQYEKFINLYINSDYLNQIYMLKNLEIIDITNCEKMLDYIFKSYDKLVSNTIELSSYIYEDLSNVLSKLIIRYDDMDYIIDNYINKYRYLNFYARIYSDLKYNNDCKDPEKIKNKIDTMVENASLDEHFSWLNDKYYFFRCTLFYRENPALLSSIKNSISSRNILYLLKDYLLRYSKGDTHGYSIDIEGLQKIIMLKAVDGFLGGVLKPTNEGKIIMDIYEKSKTSKYGDYDDDNSYLFDKLYEE